MVNKLSHARYFTTHYLASWLLPWAITDNRYVIKLEPDNDQEHGVPTQLNPTLCKQLGTSTVATLIWWRHRVQPGQSWSFHDTFIWPCITYFTVKHTVCQKLPLQTLRVNLFNSPTPFVHKNWHVGGLHVSIQEDLMITPEFRTNKI